MSGRRLVTAALTAFALTAAPAHAEVAHVVQPGETLWSIAAANNLTTNALARYNGVGVDYQVALGSTVKVPTVAEAAATIPAGTPAPSGNAAPQGAPPALGAYTVQAGDTLSGIAARAGVSTQQLAWMNGLKPDAFVITGTPLKLPTGSGAGSSGSAPATSTAAQPKAQVVPAAAPTPTPTHTTSAEIGSIAAQHGVPGSLASAVAWQESGFNNAAVSAANARGVMQVMPGTWQWVQDNLAAGRLNPASAQDNVQAGVLYLRQLLQDTGGDQRTAIAAYYQGLGSVREHGMLPETQRYVDNVMALRGRFGG
jgi:soluble lytic murein transglycosylase-like protein